MLTVAALVAYATKFGSAGPRSISGVSYSAIALVGIVIWMIFLLLSRAYEDRFLGFGAEEMRRVVNASIRFVAAVALAAYGFKVPVSRGFVVIALILGTALLAAGRGIPHFVVRRLRKRGEFQRRIPLPGERRQ